MLYQRDTVWLDVRNYYDGVQFTGERVAWVAVKGAEKSNYGAYLIRHEAKSGNPTVAVVEIGYKNAAAAQKAKASDTVTLIVMLENGVVPFEVKVPVKNVK